MNPFIIPVIRHCDGIKHQWKVLGRRLAHASDSKGTVSDERRWYRIMYCKKCLCTRGEWEA